MLACIYARKKCTGAERIICFRCTLIFVRLLFAYGRLLVISVGLKAGSARRSLDYCFRCKCSIHLNASASHTNHYVRTHIWISMGFRGKSGKVLHMQSTEHKLSSWSNHVGLPGSKKKRKILFYPFFHIFLRSRTCCATSNLNVFVCV